MQFETESKNSLPNSKILNGSKLKAIAHGNSNVAKMITAVFDGVEKEKEKCFQKASSSGSLTLSQRRNFRHFQTERVCRRQFQI